jgi:hypothetical protein
VEKDIFPDDMTGVTFYNCNLDNVYVPPGNTVIGGSQRRIKVQNDWEDWILEKKMGRWQPKEPMNKEERLEKNISIDPRKIPKKKFTLKEREDFERQYEQDFIPIIP